MRLAPLTLTLSRRGEGTPEPLLSGPGCISYFLLGKLNSAPHLMPAGQRVVTVLRRV